MKNYTSGVPVSRTIAKIEIALAKAGAERIMKNYVDAEVESLSFVIHKDGRDIAIKLPVNHEAIEKVLREQVRRPRQGTYEKIRDQAMRTGWKLMQDWIEVQLSLIEMQQAEALEVFLPYVWDGKQTLFRKWQAGGYKQLGSGKKGE